MTIDSDTFGINIGQEFQGGLSYLPGYTDETTLSAQVQANFLSDIRFLKGLGIRRFRFAAPDYTWANRLTYQKALITLLAQEGDLHIEWGICMRQTNKPSYWDVFLSAIDAHVQWFQTLINTYAAQGVTGKWILGNENEAYWNISGTETVTNATRASNVVTVTCGYNHRLAVGDRFYMTASALGLSAYYGTVASITSSTTFTFANTGADASQDAATFYYAPITVRSQIRRFATHLKTLTGPTITVPLVYCCAQGWESLNTFYYLEPWGTGLYPHEGKGDVDEVHLNVYSASNASLETNYNSWKAQIDLLFADHGTNCTITEWNTYEDDTTAKAGNDDLHRRNELLIRRLTYLNSIGIKHYFFAYRMPSKLAEKYPAYSNTGGGIRPTLYRLVGKLPKYAERIPV